MEHPINPEVFASLPPWMSPSLRFVLVKLGGGILAMSGSIGGQTHARNRYGAYIRARTKPVNPNTAFQQRARACVSFLTEYWRDTCTPIQRTAWGTYASNVVMKNKVGEDIHLSGFNHFIRSNSVRKWYGQAIVAAGPVIFTLPDKDPTYAIDVDEAPQQIAVTFDITMDWATEAGAFLINRQGLPQNEQRNFFMGPWKPLGIIIGNPAGLVSPVNFAPTVPVAVGQRQWCACRISRVDGRLTEIFYANALTHGQAPGEVPNLIGQTQAQAEVLLANAALILGVVTTEHNDTVPVDIIISCDPVAHTQLNPGDPVDILVSLGPE